MECENNDASMYDGTDGRSGVQRDNEVQGTYVDDNVRDSLYLVLLTLPSSARSSTLGLALPGPARCAALGLTLPSSAGGPTLRLALPVSARCSTRVGIALPGRRRTLEGTFFELNSINASALTQIP